MTQVQLTDQQLNRKLTELMGYKVIKVPNTERYRMVNPLGKEFGMTWPTEGLTWNDYAFPFCTDPAASLEVQAKAIEVDSDRYFRTLAGHTCKHFKDDNRRAYDSYTSYVVKLMFTASPRERAEVAYITLSQANTATGSA